ncbi:MAG: exonuclease domain-containing protein [Anaerolineae bacterium]|jgi:DNA polymerase-3 subunit epsilon
MMDDTYDPYKPLAQVHFAVLDVETTGLSAAYGHRICEVACLRVQDGLELRRFESLVDPGRSISAGAYRVNRISAEMLVGAPLFEEVAADLLDILDGAVLVAHNAPFDLSFLAAEFDMAQFPQPEGPVVDTLALARRAYSFPRNNLETVASALGVDRTPTHRAMSDVQATQAVLEQMLWDLDRRWNVTMLDQLLDFQGGPIPYPHPQALPLPPTIAEALDQRKRVRLHYVNANGQESQRVVQPLRVSVQRGHLYLQAHCYQAGALRTFRLDRVLEMTVED